MKSIGRWIGWLALCAHLHACASPVPVLREPVSLPMGVKERRTVDFTIEVPRLATYRALIEVRAPTLNASGSLMGFARQLRRSYGDTTLAAPTRLTVTRAGGGEIVAQRTAQRLPLMVSNRSSLGFAIDAIRLEKGIYSVHAEMDEETQIPADLATFFVFFVRKL